MLLLQLAQLRLCDRLLGSVLGSWDNAMRDAIRNNKKGEKGAVRLPKILVLKARLLQCALELDVAYALFDLQRLQTCGVLGQVGICREHDQYHRDSLAVNTTTCPSPLALCGGALLMPQA